MEENSKKKIDLERMERKNFHSVPDGYFDKLPYSIQEKISGQNHNSYLRWNFTPIRYAMACFAVLSIALLLFLFMPEKNYQELAKKESREMISDTAGVNARGNSIIISPADKTSLSDKPISIRNHDKSYDTGTSFKNTKIEVDEILLSPESYLAELNADDIEEYLEMYEQEDHIEDILQD